MTEIDPGNPYSPHKSWNNRTEREELIDILDGFHDAIITIWENGQQHDKDYNERCDKISKRYCDAILERQRIRRRNESS